MNSDFKDLLHILHDCEVRYLVCGGYAVIHYAQPRYTKDIDLWIEPTPENAAKLMHAFLRFGIPLHGVTQADFASPGLQFSLGRAPCEIDFLTTVPGLAFEAAWGNRLTSHQEETPIHYLSKADLILSKLTAARPQDLADLDELRRASSFTSMDPRN